MRSWKSNKEIEMREEAVNEIIECLENGFSKNYEELHDEVFNSSYYIIGTWAAEQALNEYGVFDAIRKVQDYEEEHFGEVTTELHNPETLLNMLWYIIGEMVIYELMEEIETLEENFYNIASEETNLQIVKEIKAKKEDEAA